MALEPVLELSGNQAGLELTRSTCLCLLSAGIRGVCHHGQADKHLPYRNVCFYSLDTFVQQGARTTTDVDLHRGLGAFVMWMSNNGWQRTVPMDLCFITGQGPKYTEYLIQVSG